MVDRPSNEPALDRRLPFSITRIQSGQRMWSDPVVPATNRLKLTRQQHHAFALAHFPRYSSQEIASDRTAISPIATAVCRDIPLRLLPSALTTHYRNGEAHPIAHSGSAGHLGRHYNGNVISSIHDLDLYEDDPHGYDAYVTHSVPRLMRQAPKLLSLDDYNLISLGYKPVMARKLPWVTVVGVALTASNVFSGVIPLYGLALANGGPAWATWSFLVIGLMSTAVTLCLSELASAYPTTAGVHHWAYQLGSAKRRAYLSWMVGWLTIVSAASLTPATLVMFHLGVLFAWQTINLMPIRPIGYLSIISGVFVVALAVALISVMLSLTGIESSMGQVPFTAVLNYSGSSSPVYAALSSTLMGSFVFCPQDTIIRMTEESRRPERALPKLMVGSTVSSLLIGLPLVIALNYGIIKTLRGLLDESVPGIKIILSTMGDSTGTVFVAFVLTAIFFTGLMRLSIATRTIYSFARDGGVPHSSYWNHLHPRRKIPQRVSWLVTIASMCCIFPFFWGNSVAFQWISSLGCIATNISFVVPLYMRLTREGSLHFIPGDFTLGRFSKSLHILSIIWLLFLSLILMFPSTIPVTKNNFNYAPVVLVILIIIFSVSWFKARTDFTGGAKDISRASHHMPARRLLEDIYPRKSPSHSQLIPGLVRAPGSLPLFHEPPSEETIQRFKSLNKKARNGISANGPNKILPEQVTFPRLGHPTSLTPPRRDPTTSSSSCKKQQHQGQTPAGGGGTASRSNQRDQPRGQAPNLTMNATTSVQSHPDSILGIPFSESPEMMPQELTVQNSSSSSSLSPTPSPPPALSSTHARATRGSQSPVSSAAASSGLFLTRPFGLITTTTDAIVPKISIAPPTTNSSAIESAGAMPRHESPLTQKTIAARVAAVTAGPGDGRVVMVSSQQPITLETSSHSLSAIDSIFKLGQGLSNIITSGKNKIIANMNTSPGNNNRHRTGKNRVPTPYPSSLVDPTDDYAVSEYAISMMDDSRPPKLVLKLSPPSPPLHHLHQGVGRSGGNGCGGNRYSIEGIANNTNITLAALPCISQFPTLDGYPLIKSPSTMDFGVDVPGGDTTTSDGAGNRRPSNTTTIRPMMLPLSLTPTIQAISPAYTHTLSLNDDNDDDGDFEGQLAKDEFYENEHHRDNAVISISNNRPNSLFPISGAGVSVSGNGLFRLPNRDIRASSTLSLGLIPSGENNNGGGMIRSSSLLTHSTGPAATPTAVMAPASPNYHQQDHKQPTIHHQSSYTERYDPIERLLFLKAQQQISTTSNNLTSQQQLESAINPALQFFQRTQTVANWAQEQSRIQEKRTRHYARTRALKELRKQDPTATLSARSSSGSSFSDFSSLSSFSTSTSSSASASGASASKFVPQSPQQHRHQQQPSIQSRTTSPPSSSSNLREKLIINANFDEGKMLSSPRHFTSSKRSVIDSMMMEDIQLKQPTRLEMLIQEEDEDEEEETELCIDTNDFLSPSMEIESLGAGVGRL
ncbi:hypothetical protein BG015_009218 [Linnemannia schmuckeri]|uniref:Amino acid transporter n=1 Tax=Linnemannia schmuckeri TaxID=64567 RepID=A0A9P5V9X6_9FUNG|nr:hypothetical protein BG015_009218 [Linnemannia schmuckeri]